MMLMKKFGFWRIFQFQGFWVKNMGLVSDRVASYEVFGMLGLRAMLKVSGQKTY